MAVDKDWKSKHRILKAQRDGFAKQIAAEEAKLKDPNVMVVARAKKTIESLKRKHKAIVSQITVLLRDNA